MKIYYEDHNTQQSAGDVQNLHVPWGIRAGPIIGVCKLCLVCMTLF